MAGGMTEETSRACSGNKPLFMDVSADEELETTEVESLCMQCGKSVKPYSSCALIFSLTHL